MQQPQPSMQAESAATSQKVAEPKTVLQVAQPEAPDLQAGNEGLDEVLSQTNSILDVAPKPRQTHMLIADGNRQTQKLMLFGIVGLLLMLCANFGVTVLAVTSQKEMHVGKGGALRDGQGNVLSVDTAYYADSLVDLPTSKHLDGMTVARVTSDQGFLHIFFVAGFQFSPEKDNDNLFKFEMETKAGHTLTWNRPVQVAEDGNFVFTKVAAVENMPDVTITHPSRLTETVTWGQSNGRRLFANKWRVYMKHIRTIYTGRFYR